LEGSKDRLKGTLPTPGGKFQARMALESPSGRIQKKKVQRGTPCRPPNISTAGGSSRPGIMGEKNSLKTTFTVKVPGLVWWEESVGNYKTMLLINAIPRLTEGDQIRKKTKKGPLWRNSRAHILRSKGRAGNDRGTSKKKDQLEGGRGSAGSLK